MTARARAALICVVGALLGCNRSPGLPDPNYEQASRMYQQLYAQKLDDAYGEPQMDEVVSLLHRVDKHSIDAPSAQALLAAIEDGRKRLEGARADRDKSEPAAAPTATTPSIDPSAFLATARDAGPPPQDPYGAGASITEMNAASGGCLLSAEQFHENGTNVKGTIYRMSSSPRCADKLAGFVGQAALVVDGKLYRRVPESEVPRPPPPPPPPPPKPQPKPPQASAARETPSN
jgi:hypothetical protein